MQLNMQNLIDQYASLKLFHAILVCIYAQFHREEVLKLDHTKRLGSCYKHYIGSSFVMKRMRIESIHPKHTKKR